MKNLRVLLSASTLCLALPITGTALAASPPTVTGKQGCILEAGRTGEFAATHVFSGSTGSLTHVFGDGDLGNGSIMGADATGLQASCQSDATFDFDVWGGVNDLTQYHGDVSNPYTIDNFVTAGEINTVLQQVYIDITAGMDGTKDTEQDGRLNGHDTAISTLDGRVDGHDVAIENLENRVDGHDVAIGKIEDGAVFYNRDENGVKTGGVTLNDGTGNSVLLGNVADGAVDATSTDAVNGSQLHGLSNSVAEALGGGASVAPDGTVTGPTYNVGGNTYNNIGDTFAALDGLTVQYVPDASGNATNVVALTGDATGSPVSITNVAAGVNDTDAANYSQVKDRVSYDIHEDGSRSNSITLQGGATGPVTIHNVAAGKAPTDAVNMNQFDELRTSTNQQFEQVNNRIAGLSGEIRDVRSEARAGAAGAMAASAIRYNDQPGKGSFGIGMGGFKDAISFAGGVGYTSEDGRTRVNSALAWSPNTGDLSWNAGVSWTFN
ncbi:YadA-like family protein [Neorhizobium sp. T786]|uniref:YadA-like family protein n=1 Tax=Pseudorhizobium xiangyangii TaxID=2883104 RepID=UPI001CFFD3AC|nr:YadA-like family protein [Neorhizobium xiangyangii]MCB5205172.1 YadA-like family protein [Neorhizobium xiangyangii]